MICQNVVDYKTTKLFEFYALCRVGEIEPRSRAKTFFKKCFNPTHRNDGQRYQNIFTIREITNRNKMGRFSSAK